MLNHDCPSHGFRHSLTIPAAPQNPLTAHAVRAEATTGVVTPLLPETRSKSKICSHRPWKGCHTEPVHANGTCNIWLIRWRARSTYRRAATCRQAHVQRTPCNVLTSRVRKKLPADWPIAPARISADIHTFERLWLIFQKLLNPLLYGPCLTQQLILTSISKQTNRSRYMKTGVPPCTFSFALVDLHSDPVSQSAHETRSAGSAMRCHRCRTGLVICIKHRTFADRLAWARVSPTAASRQRSDAGTTAPRFGTIVPLQTTAGPIPPRVRHTTGATGRCSFHLRVLVVCGPDLVLTYRPTRPTPVGNLTAVPATGGAARRGGPTSIGN